MGRRRRAKPKEVFISHSVRDRRFVLRLAKELRSHSIRAWYSEKHIKGAHQWHDEIGKALDRCDWFVIVLSPNSVKSSWVKRELLYALNEERFENRILPLILRRCDSLKLSWTLRQFQMISFERDQPAAFREFFGTWGL